MNARKFTGDIVVFLALLTLFSGIFYALVINTSGRPAGGAGRIFNMGLMWSPAASVLLTIWTRKLDIGSIGWGWGWGWGESRWTILSYLLPLGYVTLAYLLI
jgi:hypothetical protein